MRYSKIISTLTPEKLKPYLKSTYYLIRVPFSHERYFNKFKYSIAVGKKENINFIPPIFIVSIASVCNLHCHNCLYLLKNSNVFIGGGFIKLDDFKTIIDRYAKYIDKVWLDGGEPLLHPQLKELVKIVKNHKLYLSISTNGILVEKKIDILKSFDFINVSIDSYDYNSFNRYRGGTENQFQQILNGLALLSKNKINFMNSFILSEENVEEVDRMIEFAFKIRPTEITFHNINPHGSKEYKPLFRNSKKINTILKRLINKNDYSFDIHLPVIFEPEGRDFKSSKCIQPWYYCCFDDKGDIAYCCHLRHQSSIGNIFNNYDFNSEKIKSFRRSVINGKYPQDDCLYCQRRFMGKGYGFFDSAIKKWFFE